MSAVARPVILVTRPAEDAEPLMSELARRGCTGLLAPMLRIVDRDDAPLELGDAAGFLFTSANGVRALVRRAAACGLSPAALSLPVYAVGAATARAAVEAGFTDVADAGGDVFALADLTAARRRPADGPLLHVAGTETAGDLSGLLAEKGFAVRRVALYRALAARTLDPSASAALAAGRVAGALFFSPRTARSFVTLATKAETVKAGAGLCRGVVAYCLSAAVAQALRAEETTAGGACLGWAEVRCAAVPDQAHLLALLPPSGGGG